MLFFYVFCFLHLLIYVVMFSCSTAIVARAWEWKVLWNVKAATCCITHNISCSHSSHFQCETWKIYLNLSETWKRALSQRRDEFPFAARQLSSINRERLCDAFHNAWRAGVAMIVNNFSLWRWLFRCVVWAGWDLISDSVSERGSRRDAREICTFTRKARLKIII